MGDTFNAVHASSNQHVPSPIRAISRRRNSSTGDLIRPGTLAHYDYTNRGKHLSERPYNWSVTSFPVIPFCPKFPELLKPGESTSTTTTPPAFCIRVSSADLYSYAASRFIGAQALFYSLIIRRLTASWKGTHPGPYKHFQCICYSTRISPPPPTAARTSRTNSDDMACV